MSYRNLLEQRRKQLEKAESALDALSDPDIQAQLVADPEMKAAFMAAIQGSNNGSPKTNAVREAGPNVPIAPSIPPPGSLLRAVLDGAKSESGQFTVAMLVEHMGDAGYKFSAQDAKVAAGSALKDLAGRGLIKVVTLGKGRRPTVYWAPKGEGQI
jgi:hypothetical protein